MRKVLAAVGVLILLGLLWFVLGEIGVLGPAPEGDGEATDVAATVEDEEDD